MSLHEKLRNLPSVHELIEESSSLLKTTSVKLIKEAAREVLATWRSRILEGEEQIPLLEELAVEVAFKARRKQMSGLRKVINATGVIIHTNLGRSPLSREVCQEIKSIAEGYCSLEINLETGKRGWRYAYVEELLCRLTGAEAALVVNNNAAAVFLALQTLACGREVIVSRGELVEIGGSFRIPEVLKHSGAHLVEVGTTNKTYLSDYEKAITPETALLLKVHPSNFRVLGFTHEITRKELVELGRRNLLPVLEDLGSGALVDVGIFGVPSEPTVQESIRAGIDVVTFSGDKLLGGPQAGIILGRSGCLQQMKKNHLMRALRVDKLILAALEATLRLYIEEKQFNSIPVLRMLSLSYEQLEARAKKLLANLQERVGEECSLQLQEGFSRVGGGALPMAELPTLLVALKPKMLTPNSLSSRLRRSNPAVLARLQNDSLLLDPRTIVENDEGTLIEVIVSALNVSAEE